jgi:hypothetical protein
MWMSLCWCCQDPSHGRCLQQRSHISAKSLDKPSEISGSHGGKYEDDCLLGCCVVFQRCLLLLSSGWWVSCAQGIDLGYGNQLDKVEPWTLSCAQGIDLGYGNQLDKVEPWTLTLSDWFPYPKPIPCMRFIHHPDGGSKHLWNAGKLLLHYMMQHPTSQSYSLGNPVCILTLHFPLTLT